MRWFSVGVVWLGAVGFAGMVPVIVKQRTCHWHQGFG
jgi:hypothetical protein